MRIHVWGTDFRRSTSQFRQKLFIAAEDRHARLQSILELGFHDIVYLATCNRIEFYTTAEDHFVEMRPRFAKLFAALGLKEEDYYQGYHFEGKSAVRHLLRVASSLESMAIGEPQILGQLKEAVEFNRVSGLPVESPLRRAFQFAFETAKQVRTETEIGKKSMSISNLGLAALRDAEANFPVTRMVVVGRSPILLPVLQWVRKERPDASVVWVNRTLASIQADESFGGVEKMSLAQFLENPFEFSHLFTATSSVTPLFNAAFFQRLAGKKVVFDFAEPPDVDGEVGTSETLLLMRMSDLSQQAEANKLARAGAIAGAEKILEGALREFCLQQKEAPIVRDFSAVEEALLEQLAQSFADGHVAIPPELRAVVQLWAEKLVKKNLHVSREHLRQVLRKISEPANLFY